MKPLVTISTLVLSLMFSSTSFGGWTKVSESVDGHVFYVDFENIRKSESYSYYWQLLDRIRPTQFGDLSTKRLYEVDCNIPYRERSVAATYHTQPMGRGNPSTTDNTPTEWYRYSPNSSGAIIIELVCGR